MKNRKLVFVAFLILLLIRPVYGQSTTIVTSGEDAKASLISAPALDLMNYLNDVGAHFVISSANSTNYISLTDIPLDLMEQVISVGPRFIINSANTNRFHELSYPAILINDDIPPIATNLTVTGSEIITLSWTTSEFTSSKVLYGTSGGVYDKEIAEPLFYKQHIFRLLGLKPGTTYFYKIIDIDRNNNLAQSTEQSFVVTRSLNLFLPMIRRK